MKVFLYSILTIYFVISCTLLIEGLASANFKTVGCSIKTRIEYIFPTYRLGCYLNSPVGK